MLAEDASIITFKNTFKTRSVCAWTSACKTDGRLVTNGNLYSWDASAQTPVQMWHTFQTAEVCLRCRCTRNTSWYEAVAPLHLKGTWEKLDFILSICTTRPSWLQPTSWSLGFQLRSVDPSRKTPCTGLIGITMAACVWGVGRGATCASQQVLQECDILFPCTKQLICHSYLLFSKMCIHVTASSYNLPPHHLVSQIIL